MISASEARAEELASMLAAEQALRIAAEEQALQAEKRAGYWYRRSEFAEVALEKCAEATKKFLDCDPAYPLLIEDSEFLAELTEAATVAKTTLAERRKPDGLPNLEDFVRDRRQVQVLNWAKRVFVNEEFPDQTEAVVMSPEQRALRFFEEACELFQAIAWMVATSEFPASRPTAIELRYAGILNRGMSCLNIMFQKNPGTPAQEVGGTMVTLLCLCQSLGISVAAEEKAEFARVLSFPRDHWQKRWASKRSQGL